MLDSMADLEDAPSMPKVRGLYRSEYQKLVDLGVFEGQHVELIDGQVVEMSPQGPAHGWVITNLAQVLRSIIPPSMIVREEKALVVGMRSQLVPDITVVNRPKRYTDDHPHEAFLIVEVANTSVRYDLTSKAAAYAAMGVPEYWVVDVNAETVTDHKHASLDGFRTKMVYRRGDAIPPVAFPDHRVLVDEVFDMPAAPDAG